MLLPCEMMEELNSVSEAGSRQPQARSTIQTRSQKKQDSEALQSNGQESSSEDEEDQIYFAPYSVSPDTTETGQPSFTGIQHPIEDSLEFGAETEEFGVEAEESQELPMLDRQTLTEEQLEGDPIELVDTTPPASVELEQFAFDSAESLEQEAVDDEQPGGSQKVRSSQRKGRPPETFTFFELGGDPIMLRNENYNEETEDNATRATTIEITEIKEDLSWMEWARSKLEGFVDLME